VKPRQLGLGDSDPARCHAKGGARVALSDGGGGGGLPNPSQ
jgi:hypothetical protein